MVRTIDPNRPEFELEILRQATKIFAENGYRQTTTEDIAKRVKLKKSSLYHYFKKKENILFRGLSMSLKNSIEPLLALENETSLAPEKLRKAVALQVQTMLDAPYLAHLFVTNKSSLSAAHLKICLKLRDRHEAILRDIIDQGIREGAFSPIDSTLAVKLIYGILNWLPIWWKPTGRYNRDEITAQLTDLLVDRMLGK